MCVRRFVCKFMDSEWRTRIFRVKLDGFWQMDTVMNNQLRHCPRHVPSAAFQWIPPSHALVYDLRGFFSFSKSLPSHWGKAGCITSHLAPLGQYVDVHPPCCVSIVFKLLIGQHSIVGLWHNFLSILLVMGICTASGVGSLWIKLLQKLSDKSFCGQMYSFLLEE